MALFLELVHAEASLAPVVAEARGEYFPDGGVFCGDPRDTPAAEVRFFEWLLFEREHAGGLLVEHLLPAWRETASGELSASEDAFLGTCAGMFAVGDPAGEGLCWLRDIAGLGEYAVQLRTSDGAVQTGDLIVGRLFPRGDSAHVLSPGAGCFREEPLLRAVYRDVEAARGQRDHKALRIGQLDLEAMFWGPSLEMGAPDPVTQLRVFLGEGGVSSDEIDGLIDTLAQRPAPKSSTDPFVASFLHDLLDHLAFETEVDLSAAQEKFFACWIHLRSTTSGAPVKAAVTEPDDSQPVEPEEALKAFEAERASGLDAETAISRLSARLGVTEDADSEDAGAGHGPEVALVPALIEEYLWDVGRLEGEEAVAPQAIVRYALSNLEDVELLEDLSPRRLLLHACTCLCEDQGLPSADLRDATAALSKFCSWCADNHGMKADLSSDAAFQTLPSSLVRISAANAVLASTAPTGHMRELKLVDGSLVAEDPENGHLPLVIPEEARPFLRPDDFVRGEDSDEGLSVQWCYPPELSAAR